MESKTIQTRIYQIGANGGYVHHASSMMLEQNVLRSTPVNKMCEKGCQLEKAFVS